MPQKGKLLFFTLAAVLLLIALFSVAVGSTAIPFADVICVLLFPDNATNHSALIVHAIRLPRTLIGMMVGAALALAGATMQGLFRNPLADPSIIGVSSGSALGAGVAIVLFVFLPPFLQSIAIAALAFVGGVLTTALVYKMGTGIAGTSVSTMLLAGVAVNALAGSGMGVLNYLSNDSQLRNITFWQMGSLSGASWNSVVIVALILLPASILLLRYATALNALLLGESEARHVGINVQRIKRSLIVLTALVVGVSVASTGIIGFVGLVVPHLVRLLVGADHRVVLSCSAVLGAILLLAADMLARVVVAPAELPIGIVTALMGAPFFLTLLWQQRQRMI